MSLQTKALKYLGPVAIIAGAYVIYKVSKTGAQVVDVVTTDLNPASADNIVNKGVSSVVESATDGEFKSLGSWLYCKLNPNSTLCKKEAYYLNKSMDTSELSGEQIDLLYEQEEEFLLDPEIYERGFVGPDV